MGLSQIKNEDLENEKQSIERLFKCIDTFDSAVFNSGAGAGKTYALVECLKYIISHHHEDLKNHNQKIACITYTNVAADHIKQQLGTSGIVEVSTIHERIWNIISNQKSALLHLHVEKLKSEIDSINNVISCNADYKKYRELDEIAQDQFFQLMYANKKIYNKAYGLKAREFKAAMPEEIYRQYPDLISNVSHFKGLVDKLLKRHRDSECLRRIECGERGYREVQYDAIYNRDRLDKMRISHDTLLEYGYKLIERYPRMRQLVIDHYPYILIDEYQDTAYSVVKIMQLLDQYAKEIKHNILIVYFGDSVQNIYRDGIGSQLNQLHPGLEQVNKLYNRRSYSEIIDVSNKVRNNEIVQKSIYSDSDGGSVKFYCGKREDVSKFINLCAEKWESSEEKPLHCMFAKNQLVAEYSGFLKVYEAYKEAEVYKGIGYKQLNTELLSHDIVHLGKTQAVLFRLIKLYTSVRDEKQPLRDILPTSKYRNMSFNDLKILLLKLKSWNGNTLDELLIAILGEYTVSNDQIYKYIVEQIFDVDEELSYSAVIKFFLMSLYRSWDETREAKEILKSLLDIKTEELLNWFHYVRRDEKKNICYHTFHSTKGLEYEDVVVILEKDFGQDKGIFETFFKEYEKTVDQTSSQYENGRNILYVAVTRTIKNLRILYIDDLETIRNSVKKIFGKVYTFSEVTNVEDL